MLTYAEAKEMMSRSRNGTARHLLDTICEMTTEDFSKGADRKARLRLARALGLSEAAYGL